MDEEITQIDLKEWAEEARLQWPFKNMEINQCFKTGNYERFIKARTNAHLTAKRKGWKFMSKWNSETEVGMIARIS